MRTVQLVFVCYLLLREDRQLLDHPQPYLTEPWNHKQSLNGTPPGIKW